MATGNFASGFNRIVAFSEESAFGTKPARNSAAVLRRTAVDLTPEKDIINSNEIRDDFQRVEFRHGIRRVSGNINTEVGVGTQVDFMEALLRRDFTDNSATTVTDVAGTITSGVATLSGAAAAGFKVGDVVELTGAGMSGSTLLNKNCRITAVATNTITSPDFTADVSSGSITATVTGRTTFTPVSAHTSKCYTIEVYEKGLDKSIAYVGTRIGSGAIDVGPNNITTANYGVIGKDFEVIEESGGSSTDVPYFQSPAAASTGALVAGPQGTLRIGSNDLAIVTAATINIDNNITADPVIGALTVPEIFYSGQTVSGQFTLYTQDLQMLKDFNDESELSFQIVMEAPAVAGVTPGFVSIFMPRLKLSGFSAPDNASSIIQTINFEALRPATTPTNGYDSQIVIQDSTSID